MKPIVGTVWILFDLDNGHPRSNRYCWCFETRKLAVEYRKWHNKLKYHARLSKPMKYKSA